MHAKGRIWFVVAITGAFGAALSIGVAMAENQNHEAVGQHFQFLASDMPPPYATPAAAERSRGVPRPPDPTLELPPGFAVNIFASGLDNARWLLVLPNGDVLLAESMAGKITLLRDADGDGTAEMKTTFADGFSLPHGLALHDGTLYVGAEDGVWAIPYKQGDTKAESRRMITEPGAYLHKTGGHWTRNVAVDAKGTVYVAVGSAENIGEDPPERAAISTIAHDGKLVQYATGLRNPVGIAFYPGTDQLYVAVNERDGEGDELVPDYFTHVEKGAFYGWPYAYIGNHPEPSLKGKRPDLVAKAVVPDVLFRSHSAPLGLVFYTGTQFPPQYRGGAFVAHHGSWNASNPRGYKIVYVPFRDGKPTGGYDNFALGFWTTGTAPAGVMGRPVGLAQAQDGSLLVADDVGNAVWRISYKAK
jgi:glucose/arabinose dehydrogenase